MTCIRNQPLTNVVFVRLRYLSVWMRGSYIMYERTKTRRRIAPSGKRRHCASHFTPNNNGERLYGLQERLPQSPLVVRKHVNLPQIRLHKLQGRRNFNNPWMIMYSVHMQDWSVV
ncbi:hypothetical protein AVEN_1969-1 [Araneus ventricosus]|uniref:Uncharacterized protein n=1 Tax=Araneus ventricosus TaxID=182803 RepID=A0A4Y2INJ0_ARAVE|nr:hypothetical protein AVEN_1969-1 [Araneus ventricosus]